MGEFTCELGCGVLDGGVCVSGFRCLREGFLRGRNIALRGILNLITKLRQLLALLIAKAHLVTTSAGSILSGFLRILRDGLLLLCGIGELLILLSGRGLCCVCSLLSLGLRLLRGLRGCLGLLLRFARLLSGLLILALFFSTCLRGLLCCLLRILRGGGGLLGSLRGFACFVGSGLRGVGGLLWAGGRGCFLSVLRGSLCGLCGFGCVVASGVGLLGGFLVSRVVRLRFGGLGGFLCGLRCLGCFLGGLRCFVGGVSYRVLGDLRSLKCLLGERGGFVRSFGGFLRLRCGFTGLLS